MFHFVHIETIQIKAMETSLHSLTHTYCMNTSAQTLWILYPEFLRYVFIYKCISDLFPSNLLTYIVQNNTGAHNVRIVSQKVVPLHLLL